MSKEKTFKTTKGTELTLLSLKGKDYMPVQQRVLWFREERPNWSLITEPVEITENSALFRAKVVAHDGTILATAHKFEDKRGFADFIEKAETGAIGRALANVGYGTQFAVELAEADAPGPDGIPDFVDGPVQIPGQPYVITFGKNKGKKVSDLSDAEKEEIVDKIANYAAERGINLQTDKSEQSELYRQIINTFVK